MLIQHQKLGFQINILKIRSRKKGEKTRGQLASDEMEFDIGKYIDSLKHNPFWLGRTTDDINKLLVNREYIDFFMKIYMQWSKYNGYTSSNQKLIIKCLEHFEKLALSQFKVYIEVETMTHCYVCDNCLKSIFIRSANVKKVFFVFHRC